ncbi:hypothetical protein VNO78_09502 [Psophocarpus tetragonolobus]|uniref:Cupin type-1 domain-containing protein n=1 Tax=Psophocarpus tetragonolobus TaxID=3891 RepID=A0AAN9SZC6_PSOTE
MKGDIETKMRNGKEDFKCDLRVKGDSPSGYTCKPPETVKASEFKIHLESGPYSNVFKSSLSTAFVKDFPAVNGFDLAAARADLLPGGSEILLMVKGDETSVGFVTTLSVYENTMKPGDITVFHMGKPRVQPVSVLLFGNTLSSNTVAQTTLLDVSQIQKLKPLFW